ncbi:MAG TPA: hypothetical protein VKI43_05790 [Vicinamibacterales bacterium]|nr:hypothetical protein [Vicinamibacterales bacterium]
MRAGAGTLGAIAAAVVLAACGGGASHVPRSAASEWTANAAGVIDQLRADTVAASDGDTISSARAALLDESRLYGLLVAYTDFGGCRHMVGAVGAPPPGRRPVEVTLARVCRNLQRAAALFTRAASSSDPPALVAAARAVDAAAPLLDRAELELRSASLHR